MAQQNSLFPPELRTMAIVPRWSIVWTTQQDTTANHSYFVTIYAYMIQKVIKWQGPRVYLMFAALMHDLDETITGDIVSPIKPHIVDYDKMQDFVDVKMMERLGGLVLEEDLLTEGVNADFVEDTQYIIKAADRLDALLFLIMEQRRGNTIVEPLIRDAQNKLEASWRALPADEALINYTWQTVMLPAIEAHKTEGGRGL